MPFKSKAQARFLYARHPDIAKRWEGHTPNRKALPDRKTPIKRAMKRAMAERRKQGSRPPKLRQADPTGHRRCANCKYFRASAGKCKLYNYKVKPDQVSDSWEPKPK